MKHRCFNCLADTICLLVPKPHPVLNNRYRFVGLLVKPVIPLTLEHFYYVVDASIGRHTYGKKHTCLRPLLDFSQLDPRCDIIPD